MSEGPTIPTPAGGVPWPPQTPALGPPPVPVPQATVEHYAGVLTSSAPRGLTDVHPKVAVATLLGAITTIVLWVLGLTGHPLDPGLVGMITTAVAAVGGYLTPSGN